MLNLSKNRQQGNNADGETRQPLLGQDHDRVHEDTVVFSVDDDDDDDGLHESSAFADEHEHAHPKRSVRFQEEVRVIGPPLRSTMQSREAGESLHLGRFDSPVTYFCRCRIRIRHRRARRGINNDAAFWPTCVYIVTRERPTYAVARWTS